MKGHKIVERKEEEKMIMKIIIELVMMGDWLLYEWEKKKRG